MLSLLLLVVVSGTISDRSSSTPETISIAELSVSQHNAIDILKVALIYALRVGALDSARPEECLAKARAREDKAIV